ncbi:MAG: citrate transporter [Synergistaceae bacterium]|jgi:H+/gluconate symporter-like permease|nr:citrate transporter [Synergistaceae bacterium]
MEKTTELIFGLPPIVGFFPLVLYIILAFRKDIHPVVNVIISVLIGAIIVKQPILGLGAVVAQSLSSFLGLVGLIIMLGSGMAGILKKSGVAENLVNIMMRKIGVNTPERAVVATMVTSCVMSLLLGTLTGGNAVITPIVIPLLAAINMTPSTLAAIIQSAGVTGLFIGPYTPPMVTVMGITGLSYFEVLFYTGLPVSIIMWIVTYFFALHTQKKTAGIYSFSADIKTPEENYKPSGKTVRATWGFCISMVLMVVYGVYNKGGSSYALMVLATVSVVTGFAAGYNASQIFQEVMEGCGKFVWVFVMFILFDPFLAFVEKSGAFQALVDYMNPLIQSSGKLGFTLFSAAVGTWGINGAAVAQAMMIDKIFRPTIIELSLNMKLWSLIVLVGSQMTSFAYPGLDMVANMGMAHSHDLKSQMKLGYIIIVTVFILCAVAAFIY